MTTKICPNCKTELLESIIFHNVEADFCPVCLGMWFEEDELRQAKDNTDMNLNWLDFDLWKEMKNFIISRDKKMCPSCRLPLYEVNYGKSEITIDLCNVCHGIWLDRGEFKMIIDYLKKEKVYDSLSDYGQRLKEEFWEIFTGPESLRQEIIDFLTLAKVLRYKFSVQHPDIAKIISSLPK